MENNQTSKAVAQQQPKPVDLLKSVINAESVQQQFQNALGKNKNEFVASLIDLYTGDSQLQKCRPQLVVAEALRAATLHLPLNKSLGFAYIIVFNNSVKDPVSGQWTKVPTPTFVPGYKGYIQLAMRTGQYRTINADMVYEGELRNVDKLSGTIAFDGEKKSDKVVGYFCYFELLNGFSKVLYMSVEDMAKYALRYSPSFKGKEKPTFEALVKQAQSGQVSNEVGWKGNFNDMALKTVIRRLLSKYGYLSIEMMNVIAKDDDEAMSDRNGLIAENANVEVLPADNATFEEVDPATGEIKENAAPAADGGVANQPDWA
jgi:recombination protein RecT